MEHLFPAVTIKLFYVRRTKNYEKESFSSVT